MSEAEDIWFVNGVKRKENPSSILVLGNDPRKREGARSMAKKKPRGHKQGCGCAVCSRMRGHKSRGGHKGGSHAAKSGGSRPRYRNEPGGLMGAIVRAFWPGVEEVAASVGATVAIPLVGKLATVWIPVKQAQTGIGNVGLEYVAGAIGSAVLGRFRPVSGRVAANVNWGLAGARGLYIVTGGKVGLAEQSINPELHLNIDEAMAEMLPSLAAVLPSLGYSPVDEGHGGRGREGVGDREGVDANVYPGEEG